MLMMTCNKILSVKPGRIFLTGILLFICISAQSQITIGGDIYGGGREGAVGTANLTGASNPTGAVTEIELANNNTATTITVNDGTIRSVFGGGENGRVFGNTSITVKGDDTRIGGIVNGIDWNGSIHGGLFGAGDGSRALVFGHSNILIEGGTIYQNIYGGGNQADLRGSTNVTLQGGHLLASVFGGSRLADIYGYSFVDIDGAHAKQDLVIVSVYGGNDIAGNIHAGSNLTIPQAFTLATANSINDEYNAFVHSSLEATGKHIFVAQLFGGGNGDYHYTENSQNSSLMDMSELTERYYNESTHEYEFKPYTFTVSNTPVVDRVYLELHGGTFGYVYGGGNKATVAQNVDICLDNATTNANLYPISVDALETMGVSLDEANYSVTEVNGEDIATPRYQFDRVFGGNNKAAMNLQPTWHLQKASINNLYSGGNAGKMTYSEGLLLILANDNLTINNVYGGCRRANVDPILPAGHDVVSGPSSTIGGVSYAFPDDHSARILITAGNINNVYGGNDITGNVVGGNAIDIRSSINGDVYGGGNGSYAYTDNSELKDDKKYGDFYYNPGSSTLDSLNAYRPNANQAWIHVAGTENKPTVIGGSLYLGGNSATLNIAEANAGTKKATLKIGSYVIAKNVFLGSNGENMVTDEMLALYHNGTVTKSGTETQVTFSSITMNDANFAKYMSGVAVGIRPSIEFDHGYSDNTTEIGSLYFGGNRGSVTASGTFDVSIDEPVIIFEKLVAGCNNANYTNATYNINYQGGLTNGNSLTNGKKVVLDVKGITLYPGKIENGQRVWNTTGTGDAKRFIGGNIFGGCYESGYVNGDVEIKINADAIDESKLFTNATGVVEEKQREDIFSNALSVFGGGKGVNTSIRGNTIIDILDGGSILKVFGGGLEGSINGSTTINMDGGTVGKIYGGGFEGPINGHTTVNLNGGTVYDSFGGACNSTVRDYAQTFIGSALTHIVNVKGNVYGGNDFGGSVGPIGSNSTGTKGTFTSRITRQGVQGMLYNTNLLTASTYVEYVQGKIDGNIFGGSNGDYTYTDQALATHVANASNPFPHLENSFVYFNANANNTNTINQVFGASKGRTGSSSADNIQDQMQLNSYVLVDFKEATELFKETDVFGAGANCGVGMGVSQSVAESDPTPSAVVDLVRGKIRDAYGASYNEGFTLRTIVRVPDGSDISLSNIYGGGFGKQLTSPCDVYETKVYWNSSNARVMKIFGGNNNARRTLYSKVYINAEAWYDKSATAVTTVYGAGNGKDTWSQYTEVNLNNGALVGEAYGGGYGGKVLNKESVDAWHAQDNTIYTDIATDYTDLGLTSALVKQNGLGGTTNANVYIYQGAKVGYYFDNRPYSNNVTIKDGYVYGGGYGDKTDPEKGVISGTTYVGLHGGYVYKDIYAGGTYGGVRDLYNPKSNGQPLFTAKTYAYIEGGSVRNVYGAGWMGKVGYTALPATGVTGSEQEIDAVLANDIEGESNVIIGISEDKRSQTPVGKTFGFYYGVPTVERNAYGSGEDGGAVIGTAHLTIYNGYIGYRYHDRWTDDNKTPDFDERYEAKINDETWWDTKNVNFTPNDTLNRLVDSGNVFGGGYTDNATADFTDINIWGGIIRNSVYGGGEVAAIGRGEAVETPDNAIRQLKGIYKSGGTKVTVYDGKILCNVFGGGKGFNNTGSKGKQLTNGYVFGTTEVYIHGGDIGTVENVQNGDGNVFGGGNIGYVFNTKNSKKDTDGYYYQINPSTKEWITANNEKLLSEDCKVVLSPWAKVLTPNGITLTNAENQSRSFAQNEYVPTEYLDNIVKDDDAWTKKYLDESGIIVRNAVFAGGNVSSGNELYANTKTVFGNATATLRDLFYCDLITVGTEHVGGLYGDGNLTRVDGYRELNITNFGTDYYGINTNEVTIEEYRKMNDRERAYFEVKYLLDKDMVYDDVTHTKGSLKLSLEEIKKDYPNSPSIIDGVPNPEYWKEYGFVSVWAGRLINTIQRADFVGVFGSRMVMQGARDRVPEVVDFTEYTINRVGEVSLNRKISPDGQTTNGNYFGIYSIVNYLGALTSDIDFTEVRRTKENPKSTMAPESPNQTYYDWKSKYRYDRKRNDGVADNKVALASGVYLELLKENNNPEVKDWGIVTGILQLELINVMQGLGGGYVYAKNVHGVRQNTNLKHTTLSSYNAGAYSNKKFSYNNPRSEGNTLDDFQTSGNFINAEKQIIDDCYPTSDSYAGDNAAPAHYWYIKGQVYIYDQYLSAYTGAADAYNRTVNIPLTITAGSHGKIKLVDVKPNKYAYYYDDQTRIGQTAQTDHILVNNKTYYMNDSISYWEWSQLSDEDQAKFVDATLVSIADYVVGQDTFPKGYVLTPTDYETLYNSLSNDDYKVLHVAKNKHVPVSEVFRSTNNMSHDRGFALTISMTNPSGWDFYYTPTAQPAEANKKKAKDYNNENGYIKAPTYRANAAGVYGQRTYEHGDLITKDIYDDFQAMVTAGKVQETATGQAVFKEAYVLTDDIVWEQANGTMTYWNKGLVISSDDRTTAEVIAKSGRAYYCIDTWKIEDKHTPQTLSDEYVFYGTNMTEDQIRELGTTYGYNTAQMDQVISTYFSPAYYCTSENGGKYGGNYYELNNNYSALKSWSSMNPEDRQYFSFNYDALDVLIDSTYSKNINLYDGTNQTKVYSVAQPIDYTAKYYGSGPISYNNTNQQTVTIQPGALLVRDAYEDIPNEQYHYAPLDIDLDTTYYLVTTAFNRGDASYSIGNTISEKTYNTLNSSQKANIAVFKGSDWFTDAGKYYYCREEYTIGGHGTVTGKSGVVTSAKKGTTQTISSGTVPIGFIISASNYTNNVPNLQTQFNVNGTTPIGTSTLYVSGQSDIMSLSRGRIFSVIYEYTYEEGDESGNNIELITEKHIINIYIQFKGGTPTIGQLGNLSTVLPGSSVGVRQPTVTPGAYEVIGGGWEMYSTYQDAEEHVNGVEFINGTTPLYWYNDGYYLAYYAKTYLGKTYSNAVQFRVGNYHDLDKVMKDKEHHLYVDHPNVQRNSKIYIDDRECTSDPNKSELDLLRDFYDLSLVPLTYDNNQKPVAIASGTLKDHVPLNSHVRAGQDLEFILTSDVAPMAYTTWTSIGNAPSTETVGEQQVTVQNCFKGNLHGDGHTISGLSSSLFNYLCGNVYNLGVTGSFTTSGIADNGGRAENCWINTTGTVTSGNAVMGTGVAVNCYYPQQLGYQTAPAGVKAMPLSSFHNGEVAYNLNGFYLTKRYELNNGSTVGYNYTVTDRTTNNLSTLPDGIANPSNYVESRFRDGDFIYAIGSVPTTNNERMFYVEPQENQTADPKNRQYFPIWPDDYIYFGQMLTYGYSSVNGQQYQQYPSSINRESQPLTEERGQATSWLAQETNSGSNNRIYRAPAYFGNNTMSAVHFNSNAVLPANATATYSSIAVYPGLTAIDFTGYGDNTWTNGWADNIFMTKVLDYNGLTSFRTEGQTQNMLAYVNENDPAKDLLTTYFKDQSIRIDDASDYDDDKSYGRVPELHSQDASNVKGHLVLLSEGNYVAKSDHLLIDKQDFNAPISYTFANRAENQSYLMWYQRTPDRFVETGDGGWQTISLPFTADIVTTQTKGEITHFYQGSNVGHEYWLREFNSVTSAENEPTTAMFSSPVAQDGSTKTVGNTFLWDYYYNKNSRQDANTDIYQQFYNEAEREYSGYPLYAAGTPYLIGFPGLRYYEFDLSGQFKPSNTASAIPKLDPQVITFISVDNAVINVTNTEYSDAITASTHNGYIFKPTYQTQQVSNAYMLNVDDDETTVDGRVFELNQTVTTVPFRPYITAVSQNGQVQKRAATRASMLYIGYTGDVDQLVETSVDRGLYIYGEHMNIVIESTLDVPAPVTIYTVAGKLLKQLTIQPGTKVTVPVNNRGVYIVNRHKIAVTK